jgi:DNA-directed RNA polymerase specialized sigma24 family protein
MFEQIYLPHTAVNEGIFVGSPASNLLLNELMRSPSPSDLLWVIGLPSEGNWLLPVLREAIRAEWPAAIRLAKARLGDDTMARELMELAITQTQESFSDKRTAEPDDVRKRLSRFYRNAVRRERRSQYKLSLWGLGNNLEVLLPPTVPSSESVDANLYLNTVLDDTAPEVRYALLMRYGGRSRWQDVAIELAQSSDSVRIRCQRELKRLRAKLNIREHESSSDDPEGAEGAE